MVCFTASFHCSRCLFLLSYHLSIPVPHALTFPGEAAVFNKDCNVGGIHLFLACDAFGHTGDAAAALRKANVHGTTSP